MRPRPALGVLLAGLLTGGLIATVATPALARPDSARARTTLSARLAPPVVTEGEPAAVVATLAPAAAGQTISVERSDGAGGWTPVDGGSDVATSAAGRVVVPLDTVAPGVTTLRISSTASKDAPTLTLRVTPNTVCSPQPQLVDPQATPEAICLALRLDRWRAHGLMGVGQQLNVSNMGYLDPLTALGGRRVSVVGFDLEELSESQGYHFPTPPLDALIQLAHDGAVLNASWHAPNPHTGGDAKDRTWHNLKALLDPSTPEYDQFWNVDFAARLELFQQFQAARVPVVFRPFHEANGSWFWWGHADPATYRAVYRLMQKKAAAAGVHNIIWAYSFNAVTDRGIADPVAMLPAKVDLAGLDSYDPESKPSVAADRLSAQGYAAVASRVKRMAFTEAGPMTSKTGQWNPAVITRVARAQTPRPIWAMLWFDDQDGKKQISSLAGGPAWLDSCSYGYCQVR